MKVVLFGAGYTTEKFIRFCKYNVQMSNTEIVAICDNNKEKIGKNFCGYKVCMPEEIRGIEYDGVIVSELYKDEMSFQLNEKIKINKPVWTSEEYKRITTIKANQTINIKKKCDEDFESESFNTDSIVVYTAIFNNYDSIKEPAVHNSNVKYVCFTDNENIQSREWEIRYVKSSEDPRKIVREYKMLPHRFFPEFATSIWIDACFQIKRDLKEIVCKYQKKAPVLLMPHYERICLYDEAAVCICDNLDDKNIILEQINSYYNDGFPANYGLPCGGLIIRKHHDENVKRAMELWYEEICRASKRDQISLPYILWKSDLHYDLCDEYIQKNMWIENKGHKLI